MKSKFIIVVSGVDGFAGAASSSTVLAIMLSLSARSRGNEPKSTGKQKSKSPERPDSEVEDNVSACVRDMLAGPTWTVFVFDFVSAILASRRRLPV
jgi:hypothetical protein